MLTGIVITRNEEKMIGDCLDSLQFCDEIIVVDNGNTDATNRIAAAKKARIIKSAGTDYSQVRNDGLAAARGDWILYVDADERVSPQLKDYLIRLLKDKDADRCVYAIARTNIYLGHEMKYGGWGGEHIIRLFPKKQLKGWKNPLHEQPVFTAEVAYIQPPLLHYSHRDLSSMLKKTLEFTAYEAKLRFAAGHPPVTWWRFFRVMLTEFWLRFVRLSAWKDGTPGVIDGLFQVFNTFIIYARLWEMQQVKHADR
jgi:(heptosyl)LPS beta-1,4-glucosyltransferase